MTMQRAMSCLEIKSIDEEKREIVGLATTPSPDRVGDIVEPKGAQFKLPVPLLWQHDHSLPIGHVSAARVTSKGIEVTAKIAKVDEEGTLKNRLDEAWQSMKAGLVRGLSIGFKPLESSRLDGDKSYGMRYLKWLWLELSAVTVPANADCSITTLKNLDRRHRASAGLPVVMLVPAPAQGPTKPQSRGAVKLLPKGENA